MAKKKTAGEKPRPKAVAKPAPPTPEERFKLAEEVAANVRIHRILLAEGIARRTADADQRLDQLRLKIDVVGVGMGIGEEGELYARPTFRCTGSAEAGDEAHPSFVIEASFILVYSLPAGATFSDNHVAAFAEINGVFNAWPYWREFVQNSLARMDLPTIPIPVFRLG